MNSQTPPKTSWKEDSHGYLLDRFDVRLNLTAHQAASKCQRLALILSLKFFEEILAVDLELMLAVNQRPLEGSGVAKPSGVLGIFRDERRKWRPPPGNPTQKYPFFGCRR